LLLLLSTLHEQIRAVGFDMDYTLAQYYSAFDLLAFEGAREKLVKNLGYPAEVAQFEYDPNHFARGLVIDKQRGNIIKVATI
jgi:5'-nucleotidase